MHDKVRRFLDEHEAKEAREREKFLISIGLYEKVYSDNGYYTTEYPYSEWSEERQNTVYYRKVPIAVTDEEFEKIKRCTNKPVETDDSKNPVAVALSVIGWIIMIVGFILGIAFGVEEVSSYYRDELTFSFEIAFTYWGASIISGIMFLGFAEIIKLLEKIKNKK